MNRPPLTPSATEQRFPYGADLTLLVGRDTAHAFDDRPLAAYKALFPAPVKDGLVFSSPDPQEPPTQTIKPLDAGFSWFEPEAEQAEPAMGSPADPNVPTTFFGTLGTLDPQASKESQPTLQIVPLAATADSAHAANENRTSPSCDRVSGVLLAEQAAYDSKAEMNLLVEETNLKLRERLGREGQLLEGDWVPVLQATYAGNMDELAGEWAAAGKAVLLRDPGEYTATGAYLNNEIGVGAASSSFRFDSAEKIEVPAADTEDFQHLLRIALAEAVTEFSANPLGDGQKILDVAQMMSDATQFIPDFDPYKAGFLRLKSNAIYYRAAYPNESRADTPRQKFVSKCYAITRQITAMMMLRDLEAAQQSE